MTKFVWAVFVPCKKSAAGARPIPKSAVTLCNLRNNAVRRSGVGVNNPKVNMNNSVIQQGSENIQQLICVLGR